MRMHFGWMIACAVLTCTAVAQQAPAYKNSALPTEARVRDLLGRMTLQEKVAQLESSASLPSFLNVPGILGPSGVDGVKAKAILGSGMGTYVFVGDFAGDTTGVQQSATNRNLLQKWTLENTRLGIPILFHGEALHGVVARGTTSFPEVVGLGSTWDRALVKQMFGVVAQEARAMGNQLVLAPVLDISRDPRFGRDEEMYSEDPYLVAQMGIAAITGLQGDSGLPDSQHVIATAKHFVHGQPENGTNVGPSDYSERTMREVFLYPFEQAVRVAHVDAVLASYNENEGGIPAHADPWLLKDVLRGEFGFTGPVLSDYFGVRELQTRHHVVADTAAAGLLAFRSGVDMELPEPVGFPSLVEAVEKGALPVAQLDAAVARVLRLKFQIGLFEHPFVDAARAAALIATPEHALLSRKVADESIVLLRNERNILPLNAASIKILAVIGPNADKVRMGGYSGSPNTNVTVLQGLQKRLDPSVKMVYAEGCRLTEPDTNVQLNQVAAYKAPDAAHDEQLISQAVDAAKSADTVVLVLGGNEVLARESFGDSGGSLPTSFGDSDSIALPGRQNELVRRIVALGKPTVAVLINGRAYSIPELVDQVPGILEAWYPGQETGTVVADVLFGDVNPSGHLPVTIARTIGQLPVFYYKHPAARRGYVLDTNEPLFPFGFGLSYTTFEIGKPKIDRAEIEKSGTATVSIEVKNTGTRDGDDVLQLYVHHDVSSIVQPVTLLKDFRRIHVAAGKAATVSFLVGAEQLSILDARFKPTVEAGSVQLLVGDDSAHTQAVALLVKP